MKWYEWLAIALIVVAIVYLSNEKNRETVMSKIDEVTKQVDEAVQSGVSYVLNAQQEAFIRDLHPQYQNLFRAFIKRVQDETGYTVIATSGYRSFGKQQDLKNENASNASPGYSLHNYGLSLDLNAVKGNVWLRKSTPKAAWLNSGIVAIAKSMGLEWGGEIFSTYYDPVHFQVPGYNTATLFARAKQMFGSDPYKIIGNQVNLT
jgi:hypothetical protein